MARFLLYHAMSNAAEHSPGHEAVRISKVSLDYRELENKSNQLARTLVEQGVSRGDRVGIYMNKSLESTIAIYGIMKAGGAYVPLDPFAPISRVAYILQDCGIRHLIADQLRKSQLAQILAQNHRLLCLIGSPNLENDLAKCISWQEVYTTLEAPLNVNLTEQDLAYILYTSGSTGFPKGVMHTHRSGLSFAEWAAREYSLTPTDRISNHAPLHFDLSTFDFFASAIAGATTIIIPEALAKFPADISKLIEEERISVWYSVPYALIQLMQRGSLESHDLSSIRWFLFAGEVFPTKHLRHLVKMFPNVRFSNLYGPTETNVCTFYNVGDLPDTDEPIPIGKPCTNIEDLVVDPEDQSVGTGEVGELLIRGGVVMKGYWGQPDTTAKSFYRRQVFNGFEDIFYRTGDLVQLDEDGNYHYVGRRDRQIKIRGYRVELDEVEVALLSHPGVEEAAAYSIPDAQGSNLIAASIIPKQRGQFPRPSLDEHLKSRLPSYAIPTKIEIVSDFPRTSTGKIDRRELQARTMQNSSD